MTVFIFQGAWIFVLVNMALQTNFIFSLPILLPALVASLIMGASYPLTQVYQHQQDANDGVRTLSMQLGIRGTFWFTIPAGYYLINYVKRIRLDETQANFEQTMRMSTLGSICMNCFFAIYLMLIIAELT